MTFNQQLIEKARKGEIAILNDGDISELVEICREVDSEATHHCFLAAKYVYLSNAGNGWQGLKLCNMPAHSVKDFFMTDTTMEIDLKGNAETIIPDQPRTYKVTRQQMKEIWEAAHNRNPIRKIAEEHFAVFADDIQIDDVILLTIRHCFNQEKPEVLVKYFPSFWYIPEGEPVLCRDNEGDGWTIGVSDGNGFAKHKLTGTSITWKQIIPFTKNPPK